MAGTDVYVRDNGGEPLLWLAGTTDTEAMFTGEYGHTYAFFTRSHDRVGHVEPLPLTPDVVVRVVEPLSIVAGPSTTTAEGTTLDVSDAVFQYHGDAQTLRAWVDHGDGSVAEAVLDPVTGRIAYEHIYADDGTYTATVTVRTMDGRQASDSRQIRVENVAPRLETVADVIVPVGGRLQRRVAFADPGTDTWTATVDFGDGRAPAVAVVHNRAVVLDRVYSRPGTFRVALTVTDDDGGTSTTTFQVVVANPPRTAAVIVNDGNRQRSMVTSLTVDFDTRIVASPGAFELRRANGTLVALQVVLQEIGGRTRALLTFTGRDIVGGSLADGTYQLTVHGSRIRSADTGLAMTANRTQIITRRYGDLDGDGRIGASDLVQTLLAVGSRRGQMRYLWYLDRDANGRIDLLGDFFGW